MAPRHCTAPAQHAPQRRNRRPVAQVAQRHAGIALHPVPLRPHNRSPGEPGAKIILRQLQQLRQRQSGINPGRPGQHRISPIPRGPSPRLRLAVDRANILANVAPENPIPHQWTQLPRDRPPVFDRQIRNTTGIVHHIRGDNRPGGAIVNAADAGAAGLFQRRIRRQRQIGNHLPQKHPRPVTRRQDISILAEPADARPVSRRPVQHRPIIHIPPRRHPFPQLPLQPPHELPHPPLHRPVIIPHPGIPRHPPRRRPVIGIRQTPPKIANP